MKTHRQLPLFFWNGVAATGVVMVALGVCMTPMSVWAAVIGASLSIIGYVISRVLKP